MDHFWKPLHLQKPYRKFERSNLNFCEKIWEKIVLLPSHPNIDRKVQDKVCKILNSI